MDIPLIKGEKAIALVCQTGAVAFVMCANNVVVQHNALKKIKRSFASIAQSQWQLSITVPFIS
ncbi:MAG: hypothetical protein ACYT04_98620, partial [Nostoc sp.]